MSNLNEWSINKIRELEKENKHLKDISIGEVHSCSKHCKRPMCVMRRENEKLTKALEIAEEKIQLACEPRRQRDLSQLASNPPRNGAVYDIQNLLKDALAQIEKIKKEEK